MHSAHELRIKIARLSAPDNMLSTLTGITLRRMAIDNQQRVASDVSSSQWQEQSAIHTQQVQVEIEGVVHDASLKLRKAAWLGEALQCELTLPDFGVISGNYYASAYEEFADAEEVLRFRALLASSGAQSIVLG